MKREDQIKAQIESLPKGSITKKTIQGKDRYYLQWREGDKVKSRYVKVAELSELAAQIEQRKALQQELLDLQIFTAENLIAGSSVKVAAESAADYQATVKVDAEAAKGAERVFESLGFDLATGVNMFLRQVVREQRYPYALDLKKSKWPRSANLAGAPKLHRKARGGK
ncbi:MAG: hypothetical protein MJZ05_09430 [Fibrobacter sp.]|nr:hypothetical protein [Fibrobacter sp.]